MLLDSGVAAQDRQVGGGLVAGNAQRRQRSRASGKGDRRDRSEGPTEDAGHDRVKAGHLGGAGRRRDRHAPIGRRGVEDRPAQATDRNRLVVLERRCDEDGRGDQDEPHGEQEGQVGAHPLGRQPAKAHARPNCGH